MIAVALVLAVVAAVVVSVVASRRSGASVAETVAAAAESAADTVLQFKSHVGIHSPFFVPRVGSEAPSATLTGPTGTHPCDVIACATHPQFGQRWQIIPPTPWTLDGVYQIGVSTGELYEVLVQPARPYLRPAEIKRLRRSN